MSSLTFELGVMARGLAGNADEADDHSEVKLLRAAIERIRNLEVENDALWKHLIETHKCNCEPTPSSRITEGMQCKGCGGVYNGEGDINLCPSCRERPGESRG
jgi:hypothetical protein